MTDSQAAKADETKGSHTIRIELPGGAFKGIRQMMAAFCSLEEATPGCCERPQDICCTASRDDGGREYTFVIKRKG